MQCLVFLPLHKITDPETFMMSVSYIDFIFALFVCNSVFRCYQNLKSAFFFVRSHGVFTEIAAISIGMGPCT